MLEAQALLPVPLALATSVLRYYHVLVSIQLQLLILKTCQLSIRNHRTTNTLFYW